MVNLKSLEVLLASTLVLAHSAAAQARMPAVDRSPHEVRQVIVAPHVALEVLDWGGSGSPVVFLAGYGNSAHVFDDFAPKLRDKHRVIGITRRGFGASSLPVLGYDNATRVHDIVAVLDTLGIDTAYFVGHSFGGTELTGLSLSVPSRVAGLVYLDAGFDFAEMYGSTDWMKTPIPKPPVPGNTVWTTESSLAYSRAMTGPGYPIGELLASDSWAKRAGREGFPTDSQFTWLIHGVQPVDWGRVHSRALSIYGVPRTVREKYPWYDRLTPEEKAEANHRFAVESTMLGHQRTRFRNAMKNGRVVEILGGRHYVFLTNRAQVLAELRAFLQ